MTTQTDVFEIIYHLWQLEEEWEELADPQMTWYGNMNFRKLDGLELERLVSIQDEQKRLKGELKRKLGWLKYLKYRINPTRFFQRLSL